MFRVQKKMCATCIYRPDSPLDLKRLEDAIRDPFPFDAFRTYRICHHSENICCRGFWDAHKNEFNLGRIAQRLGMVEFVTE
jgi:hypothetical protein